MRTLPKNYFFPVSDKLKDCLFLSVVIILSGLLFIGHLGFYSDDFGFLETFSQAPDQSLIGIFSFIYTKNANVWMRPAETFYKSGQYLLFGFHPLGYHLVNSVVLLIGFLLLYLILRELQLNRLLAFSVAVVYAFLPHYSSNRLWFTASMISLSVTLYLFSLFSFLKALKYQSLFFWIWYFLGIISMLISLLCYEVFLPLFIFNLYIVWYHSRKLSKIPEWTSSLNIKMITINISILLVFLSITFVKYLVSYPSGKVRYELNLCLSEGRKDCMDIQDLAVQRLLKLSQLLTHHFNLVLLAIVGFLITAVLVKVFYARIIRLNQKTSLRLATYGLFTIGLIYLIHHLQINAKNLDNSKNLVSLALAWWGQLAKNTIAINYIDYGLKLPLVMWQFIHDYPNSHILILSLILGISIAIYCYNMGQQFYDNYSSSQKEGLRLLFFGLTIFILGYAIFLTNKKFVFTATSLGNRTAIASAIGVAFTFVGVITLISDLSIFKQWRKVIFCLLIALICMSGSLINNTIASLWVQAAREQQAVIATLQTKIPSLPNNSRLLLDGVCPYLGPAPIFEGPADISSALRLLYKNPTLDADVVKPRMKVEEKGIATRRYGNQIVYPYDQLMIYNPKLDNLMMLVDAETANLYFQKFNPDRSSGCPGSYEGEGTPIL